MFQLRLLGGASLEAASSPLSGRAVQRRRVALLAILALEHPRPVGRDRLIAWLWPEHDTERARHLLRDSLYLLRNALGDDALPNLGDELRLNPDRVRCDVWVFEEALAQERPEAAVRAYAGPLLDGFHIGGGSELEHWLDTGRERLARVYAQALEKLAEQATAEGDGRAAVEWWRRLAAADPYNGRVTLGLMEALEAAGERAGALQQARIHATLLEQEFRAEPDPEVTALAERLRRAPQAAPERAETPTPEPVGPEAGAAGPDGEPHPLPISHPPLHPRVLQPGAHPQHRRTRWKRPALPAAALLGFVAMLSVWWLLPETSARARAASEMPAREALAATEAEASPKAVAVLPCANLSRDPEEEHFSDGLTEELIGVLAQVRSLQVVARTSTFAFKGENRDIREIGRALSAGTLLECSVRRGGERVRVTAQLINAADGFQRWAETYEREGTDIFAIQSDLALRIASALEAELTLAERVRIARRPTDSPEAHAFYLKGRYFWNQRTSSGYTLAIDYFERAIAIDPHYALAHAGLAYAYSMQGMFGDLTPYESSVRTRDAALRALELDPELAEAYTVLGGYYHVHAWESEAAERAHLRALELDPDYPTGRQWYANYLTSIERFEEALAERKKAVELDPLSAHQSLSLGSALLALDRPDEALEHLRNALEVDSTYWQAHVGLAHYYDAKGRLDDAIRTHRRAVELSDVKSLASVGLAGLLVRAGRQGEARAVLAELQAEAVQAGIYSPGVAWVLLAMNDVEGALAWLERAYRQKHPSLRFIGRPPRLADDARYLDLRRRIGLPQ